MALSPVILLFLTAASAATAVLSAVVGMAGGIVLLSIMTFFLPITVIIPVHGLAQLTSNSARAYMLRSHVHRAMVGWFLLGLPLGTVLAIAVIRRIKDPTVFLLLIAAIILFTLFRPKKIPAPILPIPSFWILGTAVGLLGPLVGATGPLIAPFFLRPDLDKEGIVATKAACQLFGHIAKIPTFLVLAFPYRDHLTLILCLSLATIVGTRMGVHLLHKIDAKAFLMLYRVALLAAALRLVYKAILG